MRIVKWIAGLVLFSLCFVFTGEFFQFYLENFTNDYYHAGRVNSDIQPDRYKEIFQICEKNNVGVFFVKYVAVSVDREECYIYATQSAYDELKYSSGITAGTCNSLISGSCVIAFNDALVYAENTDILGNLDFYFTGEEADIRLARKLINENEKTITALERNNSVSSWLYFAVWSMVLAFLLLLTWFAFQFDAKRLFVKISLGASKRNIILSFATMDAAVFIVEFIAAFLVLGRFFYVSYKIGYAAVMFAVFVLFNSLIYLTLYKYSYKEIFSGANLSQRLLSTCYVFKGIVFIITLAMVSLNVSVIAYYSRYLSVYTDIDRLNDSYVLRYELYEMDYEESVARQKYGTGRIFIESYLADNVTLDTMISERVCDDGSGNIQLIMANDNARDLIHSEEILNKIGKKDFYIFYPQGQEIPFSIEEILGYAEQDFAVDLENVSYEECCYSDNIRMAYFDLIEAAYGFEIAEDPVILYCNISPEKLQKISSGIPRVAVETMTVLYKIGTDELDKYREEYGFKSLERVPIVDICHEHRSLFERRILLNCVISGLLILIELSIVMSISRLEYMVNARKLAIKKILGYGMFKKCSAMIVLELITIAIGIVAVIVPAAATSYVEWYIPLVCSLAFVIIEGLLLLVSMSLFERSSEIKILKGGSL